MKIAISILIMGAGILASCASPPAPPSKAILAAEVAIFNAEKIPVQPFGNSELILARQKLDSARKAVVDEEMVLAEQLALESLLSSELAVAKTSLGQANQVSQDMKLQNKAIQQEMLRNRKVSP
jgi:hypothetical protein